MWFLLWEIVIRCYQFLWLLTVIPDYLICYKIIFAYNQTHNTLFNHSKQGFSWKGLFQQGASMCASNLSTSPSSLCFRGWCMHTKQESFKVCCFPWPIVCLNLMVFFRLWFFLLPQFYITIFILLYTTITICLPQNQLLSCTFFSHVSSARHLCWNNDSCMILVHYILLTSPVLR